MQRQREMFVERERDLTETMVTMESEETTVLRKKKKVSARLSCRMPKLTVVFVSDIVALRDM